MNNIFNFGIIVHRGKISNNIAENTLNAFMKSIDFGYAIELDVRLLKDKTIVVFHDDNLKRLTGVFGYVENYTYEELKKFKVNGIYTIPTLQSVLKLVKGEVPVLIDIKGNIKDYILEEELLKLLAAYKGIVWIQSFQVRSLNYMWRKEKKYKYGLIVLNAIHLKLFTKLFINFCCSFVSCHINHVKNKYMQKIRKNKVLIGWVITNKSDIQKYGDYCDNFICENIE